MEQYDEIQNRQMMAMLKPAQERLKKFTVEEICRKANLEFDKETEEFIIHSMDRVIRVHYPDFEIKEKLEMWHHLTLLQYMDTADGTPLADKTIGLQQMRGGLSRGKGFDKDLETMFVRYFTHTSAAEFREACEKLNGTILQGKADVTAVIPYAPMFPITVTFWEADDEFPASGKLLVDALGEHYLTIEAAGGACAAVVLEIKNKLQGEENPGKNAGGSSAFSL